MPPLPLHDLEQVLVRLVPALFLVTIVLLLRLLLLPVFGARSCFLPHVATHHDHAGGALRLARDAQLGPAGHVDVRDAVVLGEHGDVADDVHGRDVGGEDDDPDGQGFVRGRGGFADRFDDFFHAALEGPVGGRCEWAKLG